MATAYLSLGSNQGERESNIHEAIKRLSEHPDIRLKSVSSMYETAPIGITEQSNFINAVASIETDIKPVELLRIILEVENRMGRKRGIKWGPRIIDVDLLMYDNISIDKEELILPHPRMTERMFVIMPLSEIAPDLRLPGGETPVEILEKLKIQRIRRLSEAS